MEPIETTTNNNIKTFSNFQPIRLKNILTIPVQCFLLQGLDDHFLLIDTGQNNTKDYDIIMKEIGEKKIEFLIVSHCHFDHSGNVKKIKELKGCKIIINEYENEFLKVGSMDSETKFVWRKKKKKKKEEEKEKEEKEVKMKKDEKLAVNGDVVFKKDDEIDEVVAKRLLDNYGVKIIDTHGHTEGSISVYNVKTNEIFIGDVVFTNLLSSGWGYHKWYNDFDKVLESMKKIINLNPKRIYASHVPSIITLEEFRKKLKI